jgi:hypothetical protein
MASVAEEDEQSDMMYDKKSIKTMADKRERFKPSLPRIFKHSKMV